MTVDPIVLGAVLALNCLTVLVLLVVAFVLACGAVVVVAGLLTCGPILYSWVQELKAKAKAPEVFMFDDYSGTYRQVAGRPDLEYVEPEDEPDPEYEDEVYQDYQNGVR